MNIKKISFLLLIILINSSCTLTGKVAPIQYFTLNKVENSCIKNVEISGPAHLLSEKIMLRKGMHSIGSVGSSYWIAPLQTLLPDIISSEKGTKQISLKVNQLILNVDSTEVIFSGAVKNCPQTICQEEVMTIKSKTTTDTFDIIKAYQTVINQLVVNICAVKG